MERPSSHIIMHVCINSLWTRKQKRNKVKMLAKYITQLNSNNLNKIAWCHSSQYGLEAKANSWNKTFPWPTCKIFDTSICPQLHKLKNIATAFYLDHYLFLLPIPYEHLLRSVNICIFICLSKITPFPYPFFYKQPFPYPMRRQSTNFTIISFI